MRGTRCAGQRAGSIAASRSFPGRSSRSLPSRCRTSKKNGVSGTVSRSASGSRGCRSAARGLLERPRPPVGPSAIASPSRITARSGSARTASTISGTRSVTSSSLRVNTRRRRRRGAPGCARRRASTRPPPRRRSSAAATRRGLGEHRLNRAARPQAERIEAGRTGRQRGLGDRREIAREHGRAAHGGASDPGGARRPHRP